jgi:hypothetical protein
MSSPQEVHSLPPDDSLQLRQDYLMGAHGGCIGASTHAEHVDTRTGFMPPDPPLSRLPEQWELWETTLEAAMQAKLRLAVKPGLTIEDEKISESWRNSLKQVSTVILMQSYTLTCVISYRSYQRLNSCTLSCSSGERITCSASSCISISTLSRFLPL